jgi:hypothetical protein
MEAVRSSEKSVSFIGLHVAMPQRITLFIVTRVRTRKPAMLKA